MLFFKIKMPTSDKSGDVGHDGPQSGWCPLECCRGISGSLSMQRRAQLEDEQWGQMRSYLTHIWHSTCPNRWLMNNWGDRSSAGRRKNRATVYVCGRKEGLQSSICMCANTVHIYESLLVCEKKEINCSAHLVNMSVLASFQWAHLPSCDTTEKWQQ